ncbi:MAG: low molecular weight protein-tyrosine-phosphatase [Bacteroidales bacterium]
METKRILFVCLGNICRSPAAETIFGKLASDSGLKVKVDSAGTSGWHEGEKADPRMRHSAKERGYNITSIARKFKSADFDDFDMIIAMDDSNYEHLISLANNAGHKNKVSRMAEYIMEKGFNEIPDPYYGGDEGFTLVIDLLEYGSKKLIADLKKETNDK